MPNDVTLTDVSTGALFAGTGGSGVTGGVVAGGGVGAVVDFESEQATQIETAITERTRVIDM
jgi:hypothetical protein